MEPISPTFIQGKSLHLSNPDSINDLYQKIHDEFISPRIEGPFTISTAAGTMTLYRPEAERLYALFQGWDKKDNEEGLTDIHIDEGIVKDAILDQVSPGGSIQRGFGVRVYFLSLDTSNQWQSNYALLSAELAAGRLEYSIFSPQISLQTEDIWSATTVATFSGMTQETAAVHGQRCLPAKGCEWKSYIHDPRFPRASVDISADMGDLTIKGRIRYNLSANTTPAHEKSRSSHELGHMAYSNARWNNERKGFDQIVIEWAKEQEAFANMAREFEDYQHRLTPLQKRSLDNTFQETADPSFLKFSDLASFKFRKIYYAERFAREADLDQASFNSLLMHTRPELVPLRAAEIIRVQEVMEIDPKVIAAHEELTLSYMESLDDPILIENYQMLRGILPAIEAYLQTDDFRRHADPVLPPALIPQKP